MNGSIKHDSAGLPRCRHVRFGSKQTLRKVRLMSALPPKADIGTRLRNVRFVVLERIAQIWEKLAMIPDHSDSVFELDAHH